MGQCNQQAIGPRSRHTAGTQRLGGVIGLLGDQILGRAQSPERDLAPAGKGRVGTWDQTGRLRQVERQQIGLYLQ